MFFWAFLLWQQTLDYNFLGRFSNQRKKRGLHLVKFQLLSRLVGAKGFI